MWQGLQARPPRRRRRASAGGRSTSRSWPADGQKMVALRSLPRTDLRFALLRGRPRDAAACYAPPTAMRSPTEERAAPRIRYARMGGRRSWRSAPGVDTRRPVPRRCWRVVQLWPLWPCWKGMFFELGVTAQDGDFVLRHTPSPRLPRNEPGRASFEGAPDRVRGEKGDLNMMAQGRRRDHEAPGGVAERLRGAVRRALLAAGNRPAAKPNLDRRLWKSKTGGRTGIPQPDVQRVLSRSRGSTAERGRPAAWRLANGWAPLTEAEGASTSSSGRAHIKSGRLRIGGLSTPSVPSCAPLRQDGNPIPRAAIATPPKGKRNARAGHAIHDAGHHAEPRVTESGRPRHVSPRRREGRCMKQRVSWIPS